VYGEPTRPIRVPESLVTDIQTILTTYRKGQGPKPPLLGREQVYRPQTPGAEHPLTMFTSQVQAGFPSPADDYVEGTLDLNDHFIRHPAATFFVRVAGESMLGAGIHPGDILIVDRALEPADGRVVIAILDGELTVKRLYRQNGQVALEAENPEFPTIEIGNLQDLEIWGVVTNVIHAL